MRRYTVHIPAMALSTGWYRGKTSVAEVKDGWAKKYEIVPGDFGLPRYTYEELSGGSPQDNADILIAILAGKERGARRDMVLANAAGALLVGGKASDLRAGVKLATELIDSGSARKKLDELILESNHIASASQ